MIYETFLLPMLVIVLFSFARRWQNAWIPHDLQLRLNFAVYATQEICVRQNADRRVFEQSSGKLLQHSVLSGR